MQPIVKRGLLIGDEWVNGHTSASVHSPATGELVGTYAVATSRDVKHAVEVANTVGLTWTRMPATERYSVLKNAATQIRAQVEEIAQLLTLEQGKPLPDSRKEILFGADVFEYYAEEAVRIFGSLRPGAAPDHVSVVSHEPVGVVAGIVPWNYPVDLYAWKVAPALAAGCPVIVKPPEEAPLAVGLVSGILRDSGLPAGALADLPGGASIGHELVVSSGVRMVTATCSTSTGRAISRAAADDLTRVSLELGGHSPLIVLADADLQFAAEQTARRAFSNMGQICIAVNRVIVEDAVADEFTQRLRSVVEGFVLGDPSADGTAYGPCTTTAVVQNAEDQITDALAKGAQIVCGGGVPDGPEFSAGYYFQPTVLDQVPRHAKVMREETFGPVLALHRVSSVSEAIEVANDVEYGLAAYVFGEDVGRAFAVAEAIDAGGVGVNVNDVSELRAPFGGRKQSGIGRELGPEGIMSYLESKHIKVRRPSLEESGVPS